MRLDRSCFLRRQGIEPKSAEADVGLAVRERSETTSDYLQVFDDNFPMCP